VGKNRKSVFAALLALSLLVTGCGASSKTGAGESAKPADKPEPYHIVMVMPGTEPKDEQLVIAEINKILEPAINATLEMRFIDWSAWADKTNLMFTSNEAFDIIFTAGWNGYSQQAGKGQFIPLDDLVKQYGQAFLDAIDPEIVDAARIDGKLYAMVANKEFAADKGLTLRKDLVDKYGFDLTAIKELADLEPLLKTIKDNEPGVTPFINTGGSSPYASILDYGFYDMLGDGPGELARTDTGLKVINKIEHPKYLEYAKLMRKWFLAGYINKDAATLQDIGKALGSGKAFAQSGSFKPGSARDNSRTQGTELVEVQLMKPFTGTADATSALLAFSRTSKNPERAMQFVNLLYSDATLLNLMINGIEGKHYNKVSGNIIEYPAGMDAASSGYPPSMNWMIGNLPMTYVWSNEDPDKWQSYVEYNKSADRSRALGFVFNTEPVKSEIAATSNVEKEFRNVIITGSVDPDEYIPKYLKKLKTAGLDKIIAEKQKQLDEWAKSRNK
jgi:putative aldouronate transport system substrate-binding protein